MQGIKDLLGDSVKGIVSGKRVGVMFSGGIDSTIISFLAKKHAETVVYTIGVKGAQDFNWARKVGKEIGLKSREKVLSGDEVLERYAEIKELLNTDDLLSIELAIPVLVCSRMAKEDGVKILLCGHGADELFGGYRKYPEMYRKGENVKGRMSEDLMKVMDVDLPTGQGIAQEEGVKLFFPFLDKRFIDAVAKIPIEKHFSEDERKPVLRDVGRSMGIPENACARPKKAVQYGSGMHKLLTAKRTN